MPLTPCADVSAAAWITNSDLPWQQLVGMGPSGFEAYARLRFLPDPLYPGQPEIQSEADAPPERDLLRVSLEMLRQHTSTPDDCYFCLWDGWGLESVPPAALDLPRVNLTHRVYVLFQGSLSDFGDWGVREGTSGQPPAYVPEPAFIWPADHAWCIANDVDPHYAGIGATSAAIDQLLVHPGLDVVAADPNVEPPYYW